MTGPKISRKQPNQHLSVCFFINVHSFIQKKRKEKNTLLADSHIVLNVAKHGRLHKEAFAAVSLASDQQLGLLLLARLDQVQNLLHLLLVDLFS